MKQIAPRHLIVFLFCLLLPLEAHVSGTPTFGILDDQNRFRLEFEGGASRNYGRRQNAERDYHRRSRNKLLPDAMGIKKRIDKAFVIAFAPYEDIIAPFDPTLDSSNHYPHDKEQRDFEANTEVWMAPPYAVDFEFFSPLYKTIDTSQTKIHRGTLTAVFTKKVKWKVLYEIDERLRSELMKHKAEPLPVVDIQQPHEPKPPSRPDVPLPTRNPQPTQAQDDSVDAVKEPSVWQKLKGWFQ